MGCLEGVGVGEGVGCFGLSYWMKGDIEFQDGKPWDKQSWGQLL